MLNFRILALAGFAVQATSALGSSQNVSLEVERKQLEIALRVAGNGLPGCRSYSADGVEGPCFPAFSVKQSKAVNAWSRGRQITFTQGAIEKLNSDEFAILAGHEIAHWYLGHKGSEPKAELDADRLGLSLACEAGFNIAEGLGLFRHIRTSQSHGWATARLQAAQANQCDQFEAKVSA